MATFLLYIEAVLSVIFGNVVAIFGPIWVVAYIVGAIAGGFGIANERRWGYYLAVTVAVLGLLPFVWVLATLGVTKIFSPSLILAALFPVALFALLVHPMSREYQKIWFH